jgi:hypothetical protein
MDENIINPPNTDPPEVRLANGRLILSAAIVGFFVALAGLGGAYLYASRGTETGPGQTAQIQQAAQAGPGTPDKAEPPRQNNPNPPGDTQAKDRGAQSNGNGGTQPNGAPAR